MLWRAHAASGTLALGRPCAARARARAHRSTVYDTPAALPDASNAQMERPAYVLEGCTVTLSRADAAAADTATQLCDSLASLDATADALCAGVRLRTGLQRGACDWSSSAVACELTSVPRSAGGALGAAAFRASAGGRHSGAEPKGASFCVREACVCSSPVLCHRPRACFGCRVTRRRRAGWTARCSSIPRCAHAVRAMTRDCTAYADRPARSSYHTKARTATSSTQRGSRCALCRRLPTTLASLSSGAACCRHRTLQLPQRCVSAPRALCCS